jgi:hypothetical protein
MSQHNPAQCQTCEQEDYEQFRHTCVHESIDQNATLHDQYKITTWQRWDYQMEDATLVFSEGGKPRVICEIEVAGSTKGET